MPRSIKEIGSICLLMDAVGTDCSTSDSNEEKQIEHSQTNMQAVKNKFTSLKKITENNPQTVDAGFLLLRIEEQLYLLIIHSTDGGLHFFHLML